MRDCELGTDTERDKSEALEAALAAASLTRARAYTGGTARPLSLPGFVGEAALAAQVRS